MTQEGNKNAYSIRRIEAAKNNPEISLNDRAIGIITQPSILSKILTPEDELKEDEGRLLLLVLDSSSSMTSHSSAVVDGYSQLINRFKQASRPGTTMLHTKDIYGKDLYPIGLIEKAPPLNTSTYDPSRGGNTPLRDALVLATSQVIHEIQRQYDDFKTLRGIVMLLTDGGENASTHNAEETKFLVDSARKENSIIFIGAGVGDRSKYVREFGAVGIPEQFVISGNDIASMFKLITDETVAASGASDFKSLALRGLSNRSVNN